MKFLIRYWYLVVLAFLLSLFSAAAGLYLEREVWMEPPSPPDQTIETSDLPGMSSSYIRWNYEISSVEDLRVKLEAEREEIKRERQSLEVFRSQVNAEIEELTGLRVEIEAIRDAISSGFIEIEAIEKNNIKRLSKVYAEMKPDAAVAIFSDLEVALVVKILSQMQEERASRILAQMGGARQDSDSARRAAEITELIQKVR